MHVLENLNSDHISMPSNFKYRDALEKQVTVLKLSLEFHQLIDLETFDYLDIFK